MIYVLEGPNYAGKTTVARALGKVLKHPVYVDEARHGAHGFEPLTPRDWYVQGLQSVAMVAWFSKRFDFVVDRWLLTNLVYDYVRGVRWSDETVSGLIAATDAKVYVLNVGAEELLRRSRGDRDGLETVDDAYVLWARYQGAIERFARLGGWVKMIDGDKTVSEVLDDILDR